MTRESAAGGNFSFSTSNARGETRNANQIRAFDVLCWSYYTPVTTHTPPPSGRIRFNHRIAPANEKDWLVTGAKSPLIVGLHPRIFAVENDRGENASWLVHRHRNYRVTLGLENPPDTAWRWRPHAKKKKKKYSAPLLSLYVHELAYRRSNYTAPRRSVSFSLDTWSLIQSERPIICAISRARYARSRVMCTHDFHKRRWDNFLI